MLVAVLLLGETPCRNGSDPSIHMDPRIKESTSCKTVNRYYEGWRREERKRVKVWVLYRSHHPRTTLYSVTQFVTLFVFVSPFFFFFVCRRYEAISERENQTNCDESRNDKDKKNVRYCSEMCWHLIF